jgi:hypothetical protein
MPIFKTDKQTIEFYRPQTTSELCPPPGKIVVRSGSKIKEIMPVPKADNWVKRIVEQEWFKNALRWGEFSTRSIKFIELFVVIGVGSSYFAKGHLGYYSKLVVGPGGSLLLIQKGIKYWNYEGDSDDWGLVWFAKYTCPVGLLVVGFNNLLFYGVKTFNVPLSTDLINRWTIGGRRFGTLISADAFLLMAGRAIQRFYTVRTYKRPTDDELAQANITGQGVQQQRKWLPVEMGQRRSTAYGDLIDGIKYLADTLSGVLPAQYELILSVIARVAGIFKSTQEVVEKDLLPRATSFYS